MNIASGIASIGPPAVELQRVQSRDKATLDRLLQLYLHDFSAIRSSELTEDGTYQYRFFDAYFTDPDCSAWFIRDGGRLAGFAMVRTLADGRRAIAEFFVVRAHRRRGVGRGAALTLFAQNPGRWEVAFDVANHEASGFWPIVVEDAAATPIDTARAGPPARSVAQVVLHFETRGDPA